jgi:hypothetical protein
VAYRSATSSASSRIASPSRTSSALVVQGERLEGELREAELYRRTEDVRQAMLAAASHELKSPVAALTAVGVLAAFEPPGERHRQATRGGPFRDGAQLVLVRGGGEPGQRPHFAIREPAVGETGGDPVDRAQRPADAQPFAHGAQLDICGGRDPVGATRGAVEGPLAAVIEIDEQPEQR